MSDDRATDPAEEQKAKFREALERKNKSTHRSAGGATTSGPARGEHAAETSKREFRRKSGG